MVKKLMLLILPLLAVLGGAFAGDMLRGKPHDTPPDAAHDTVHDAPRTGGEAGGEAGAADPGHAAVAPAHTPTAEVEWFTFPSQFFVPLVRQGDMSAIMILTLVLETDKGQVEALGHQEHRLRDALLRALMIHANTGGFDGNFTVERNVQTLRDSLLAAARSATDLPVRAVLIQDLARQGG